MAKNTVYKTSKKITNKTTKTMKKNPIAAVGIMAAASIATVVDVAMTGKIITTKIKAKIAAKKAAKAANNQNPTNPVNPADVMPDIGDMNSTNDTTNPANNQNPVANPVNTDTDATANDKQNG